MGKKWDKLVARVQALEDAITTIVPGKAPRKEKKRKKAPKAMSSVAGKKSAKKLTAPSPGPIKKAGRKTKAKSPAPLVALP